MSVSETDIAFARELFDDINDISTRKMMGGICIYSAGTIFAIVHSDAKIYLKGQGTFAGRLETMGSTRWEYTRKNGNTAKMPYWTLPDAALDDPVLACKLAREALTYLES